MCHNKVDLDPFIVRRLSVTSPKVNPLTTNDLQKRRAVSPLKINPMTPTLNPSAQRCLTRFFTGDFASRTVHFVNICVKNQQIHQLFTQFINYMFRHYVAILRERS
jgi:hypothetical protein